jgi:thioredoxin-dependent peroxiredoxin
MPALEENSPAPDFSGRTQDGSTLSLQDFRGRYVALYFYPKDDTPGCTKQACAFRDAFAELKEKQVVVIGVSADPADSHLQFATKFSLPFPLLADEDRRIVTAYGVWREKNLYGKISMGIERSCFLIGPGGTLLKIWRKVKPEENVRLVLDALP